jgi:hypothetical protein
MSDHIEVPNASRDALADVPDHPHTFPQYHQAFKTHSVPALRHVYFESKPRQSSRGVIKGNGFAAAFLKVGGRVYVKPRTLFALMAEHSE